MTLKPMMYLSTLTLYGEVTHESHVQLLNSPQSQVITTSVKLVTIAISSSDIRRCMGLQIIACQRVNNETSPYNGASGSARQAGSIQFNLCSFTLGAVNRRWPQQKTEANHII